MPIDARPAGGTIVFMVKAKFGDEWRDSPERASLLRLMRDVEAHRRRTGGRFVNVLARLRLTYASDPELVGMPHGLDRLRKAYALYLSESRPGSPVVPYAEGRDHLRKWTEDSAPRPTPRNRGNPHQH